jgi:uncharacterized protein YndB with AHSA1/START domain
MAAKSNEIQLTRIYDAPVKTVWDAFTDPKQAAHWWGPRGFTLTTHSKELKSGGHWDYTMHGPDGTDFPNHTKYLEVEKYSRLVYDHGGNKDRPPMFRVTVNFSDFKGKTKMDMTMSFATPEIAANSKKFIKKAGGDSTWDRFAEYLDKEIAGKETFVINRSFEAPVETLFEMWSNPKHFAEWMGPTGSSMITLRSDIKTNGSLFYKMPTDQGLIMYGTVRYLEVTKPKRLVYTQQFCDENEKVSRHPMAPTWPETMLTTVTFDSEGESRSRVTVKWEVQGKATAEEMETFKQGRAGMTGGWTGSFDKLEEYLAKQ